MLRSTVNLFRTDGIALFDLWDLPINLFCNQVNMVTTSTIMATEKFKTELKRMFPEVFSEGLGMCTKANLKFKKMQNQYSGQKRVYLLWP